MSSVDVGTCRLRSVHLQDGFIKKVQPAPPIHSFIPSLTKPFIEAGVHCVTTIQAPSANGSNKRFGRPPTTHQQQSIGLKTELIRLRSDVCRGILLNHILVLPIGQQLLNGTILGQTYPAPSQCRLQAWAANQNAALVMPLDTPQQKAQALRTAGQYKQLAVSEGSIIGSLVLVPPVAETGDSEYPEFPLLLMTDTIVVRGIYERLTLCIFGTRIPNASQWSLANERLWMHYAGGRQRLSELGCVEMHRREDVEGRVDINEEIPELIIPAAVKLSRLREMIEERRETASPLTETASPLTEMSDVKIEETRSWLAEVPTELIRDREKLLAKLIAIDRDSIVWSDNRLDQCWKEIESIMKFLCYSDRVPQSSNHDTSHRRVVKMGETSRSEGLALSEYLSSPPGLIPLLTEIVLPFLTEKRNNICKPEEWICIILKSLQVNLPLFKSHKMCQLRILGRILATNPGLATTGLSQDILLMGQKAMSPSSSERRASRVPVLWQRECLQTLQTLAAVCGVCSATRRATAQLTETETPAEAARLSALEKCAAWITALATPYSASLSDTKVWAKSASSDKILHLDRKAQRVAQSHLVLCPAVINAIKRYRLIPLLVSTVTAKPNQSDKVGCMAEQLLEYILLRCHNGSSLIENEELEKLRVSIQGENKMTLDRLSFLRHLNGPGQIDDEIKSNLMLLASTSHGRKALTLFLLEPNNRLISLKNLADAWAWVCHCILQDPSGPDALECLALLYPSRWTALTSSSADRKTIPLYCTLSQALRDPAKIPEIFTRLYEEHELIGIVSPCPAAVRKVARLQTNLRIGDLAETSTEILGGWESGLGVPAPGLVRDGVSASSDDDLGRVRMVLLAYAVRYVVDKQQYLVESSKETETAASNPGDTLMDQLSWISPLLMHSAITAAQTGLLIATRHLRLSEREMEQRSLLPTLNERQSIGCVPAFHLAHVCVSTISTSNFKPHTRRQLLQPELLKHFILLLETLLRMKQTKNVKNLLEAILKDVMHRWFHWTNSVTQRWIISETLRLCRGSPVLDRLRLILMITFGDNALAVLHPANSNLQWSAARSPQVPPMLPSQMAAYPAGALEGAQSLVLTMSSSSCVTRPHLMDEGPIPADRIASESEGFDPRNRRVPTDLICYLCCQVPGVNFVGADSKRVCVVSSSQGLFGRSVFGPLGNDPVSSITFDVLADIITRPLRESLKLEPWRIFQAGMIGLEQISSLMDLLVISLTDSSDETMLGLCLCVSVSVFNGGLPLLPMFGHRLEMIIDVEFAKPADREMTVQRFQRVCALISAAPHMLTDDSFPTQDSIWITQALNYLSKGLTLVCDKTLPPEETGDTTGDANKHKDTNNKKETPLETRVALKTAACGIGAFESLLYFLRRHRDVGSLFVLLTRTREIVKPVIKMLNFCLKGFTPNQLLEHLPDLNALLDAFTSCFHCPFTRALMVFDFTKTTIDSLSQDIFGASAEALMSKKTFPSDRQTSVGSINGLIDAIARLSDDNDFEACIPLIERYVKCREASTMANDIPLEAVQTFFGHTDRQQSKSTELINESLGDTAFHSIQKRLESRGSELSQKWTLLFDKQNSDTVTSTVLSFASLWDNPDDKPLATEIWTTPPQWDNFVKNRLTGLVKSKTIKLTITDQDKYEWDFYPEILRRLQPIIPEHAEDLGLSSLPLRIPMESCEEADTLDDLSCRQKRSVYAKAAKLSQQQEGLQIEESLVSPSPASSAMDDWGTFLPQAQLMRRPEPRLVPSVELSFSPEEVPMHPPLPIIENQEILVDDKFAQLSAIPEFRNFIEAGREINLPVMEIIKNPSLLLDGMLKARFLKLVESHPWVMQLIQ